jgi:hypothetical protein
MQETITGCHDQFSQAGLNLLDCFCVHADADVFLFGRSNEACEMPAERESLFWPR